MKNSNLNEKLNALQSLLNEGLAAEELDKIDAEVAKDADVAEHMDKSEEVEAPKEEEKEEPKAEEEVHEEHPEEAPVEEKHEEQPEEIKKSISDIAADVVKQESEVKAPVPSTDVALPKGTLEVQQEPTDEEEVHEEQPEEAPVEEKHEEEVHEEHPEEAPVEEKHEEEAIKLDEAIENLNNLIMSINNPSEITSDMMAQRNSIKSDVEV